MLAARARAKLVPIMASTPHSGPPTPLTATPSAAERRASAARTSDFPSGWILFTAVTLFMSFALLHAMGTFVILSEFPVFAFLVIALDVIVLYELTVQWGRSR
jgi:hypothetical protein